MRDLEIRGAGNLLGADQSGHMEAVGYDLYCKMLNDAILQQKGEKLEEDFGPFTVPEGCYFMMGDNRNNSWDSRYWNDKYVDRSEIIGKAELEYYPAIKFLK